MAEYMYLPDGVRNIILRLEAAGHTAYVVGGSVRDAVLGRAVNDYDLTTSATPEEVKECFRDERTLDTGIKHGTVTLLYDGAPYEITTYRVDGEYLDGRHPTEVKFTDNIALDLARRDFTVNAIAYNPTAGFVDPYSGMSDAKGGIIRAVGDASVRFDEDALRILRALRFSAVLGFSIHPDTAAAIRVKAPLLDKVSRERILVELRKLLGGPSAPSVIAEYSEIIASLLSLEEIRLPEVNPTECGWFTYLLSVFALSSPEPAEAFRRAMRELKSDNRTRILGRDTLLALATGNTAATERDLRFLMRDFGEDAARELLSLLPVLGQADRDPASVDRIISSGLPYRLRDLALTGEDISALGVRGAEIGRILSLLLDLVISGEVKNCREELLDAAGELITKS